MHARSLIAGNWKMNGLQQSLRQISAVDKALAKMHDKSMDVLICPPVTLLGEAARLPLLSDLCLGGQDCHNESHGAFTGEISAPMLADSGASYVITGHSERRHRNGETDSDVAKKTKAALDAGLWPIVCVGETLEQRQSGQAILSVLKSLECSLPKEMNVKLLNIAYEPIWAIGTGQIPTAHNIQEMHDAIRDFLVEKYGNDASFIRLLYGGSVKATNAAEITKNINVNGLLVGGASLMGDDFLAIISACHQGMNAFNT